MLSWKQCALPVITKMALWQLMHLSTWCMYIENFMYIHIYIHMILYMIYMFEYMIQVLWPWNRNSLTPFHCFPPSLVQHFYRFYKIILSSIFIVIIYIKFFFGKMYISKAENRLGSAITNCKTIFSPHDLSCSTAMPWLALQKNYEYIS